MYSTKLYGGYANDSVNNVIREVAKETCKRPGRERLTPELG